MKYLLILVLSFPCSLFAQTVCGIYFDYDAAGNRIKRYYDCKTILPDPMDPPPGGGVGKPAPPADSPGVALLQSGNARVFPNPTQSFVTIEFPQALTDAHYHVYDGKGSLISSGNFKGKSCKISLQGYADGTYLIAVKEMDKQYNFKVVLKH